MSVDQKIEIELALQNTSSDTIKQIADSVGGFVKQISELGKASSGTESGIAQTAKGIKHLNDKTREASKDVSSLQALLIPLVGAAGTIALIGSGLAAAATALGDFAGERIRFKNLSTDIGFSVEQMSIIIRTFENLGIPTEQAQQRLEAIGSTLKELQTYGRGSEIYKSITDLGLGDFADALLKAVNAGKFDEALRMWIDQYNRLLATNQRLAANFMTTMGGMSKSIAQNFEEKSKGVTAAVEVNMEVTKDFFERFNHLKNDLDDMWSTLKYKVMKESLDLTEQLSSPQLGGKLGAFVGQGFSLFDKKPLSTDPLLVDPSSALKRKGHKFEFEQEDEKNNKKEGNSTLEKIRDSIKNLFGFSGAKQHGGSVESGQRYLVGELEPELFSGGGNIQLVGMDGPEIIQPASPGMISPGGGFPQFVPNRFTPQVEMPSFDMRFGDWGNPGFSSRFSDWSSPGFDSRFGNWNSMGGGSRPGTSSPDFSGGIHSSIGPDFTQDNRRDFDIMLNSENMGTPSSLNAEITFKNVPPGVNTKADGDGFETFKINKSKSLNF